MGAFNNRRTDLPSWIKVGEDSDIQRVLNCAVLLRRRRLIVSNVFFLNEQ